jgi:hypothetical protein
MAVAIVGVAGFLITLWLVLSTARRLRPESLKFKAMVTKWLSLDLEMHSGHNSDTQRRGQSTNDQNRPELGRRSDEVL